MISLQERLSLANEPLRKGLENLGAGLRVAIPGIIVSFDSEKQTARVQVAIREKIRQGTNLSWETVPILLDVPILIPRAGGYALTLPVTSGDECLVIFGDCCIDAWWQSGGVQNQVEKRRHDLSDGFAVLGIWSQPHVLSDYATDAAQLRNEDGTAYIELKGDAVKIVAETLDIQAVTTINSVPFNLHTHSNVTTGEDISGPVVAPG
jgi:hypothetical protein